MPLTLQKELFNIPEDINYLNIASLSPSFISIEEAGINAVLEKSRPYTITSKTFFDPVSQLKTLFAGLIDADDYNRIATIPSVSYGMASIANNIVLNKGDEVLVADEQFPSNYYAWKKLADRYKAILKIIKQPTSRHNCGKHWNKNILAAINDRTALVAIGNVHWSNGTIFNIKEIRKKTKLHQALLILDGSQSVGAMPFSVKDIQPDALVCAGYKWLFGPYGCAYAYFGPYFDNGNPIEENWANRIHSEDFSRLTRYQPVYKPLAGRFNVGQSGSFIYVQMQIAALTQLLQWKPEAIQEYCREITKEAVATLITAGCFIENPEDRAQHLFGVKLPDNTDKELLKKKLTEQNIFISYRGDYIRVSCHLYNTSADLNELAACIVSVINS